MNAQLQACSTYYKPIEYDCAVTEPGLAEPPMSTAKGVVPFDSYMISKSNAMQLNPTRARAMARGVSEIPKGAEFVRKSIQKQ